MTRVLSVIAFYEKVIKVKADVAAVLIFLVLCGPPHSSTENFASGSLRSDDWPIGRPTAPPVLSVSPLLCVFSRLFSDVGIDPRW